MKDYNIDIIVSNTGEACSTSVIDTEEGAKELKKELELSFSNSDYLHISPIYVTEKTYGVYAHMDYEFTDLIALYDDENEARKHLDSLNSKRDNYIEYFIDTITLHSTFKG